MSQERARARIDRLTAKLEPYEPLREIGSNLWCVDGEWGKSPLRRRMTVVRLTTGSLVLHSPIRMHDADLAQLERLGRIRYLIMPNAFHGSEAPWYVDRYPDARLYVPRAIQKLLRFKTRIAGSLEMDWPGELASELVCIPLRGTRFFECAFVHAASRSLILTDAVFNLGGESRGASRLALKLNGIFDRFGPSRFFKTLLMGDREALRSSIDEILARDFDRVIMSHGRIVDRGGRKLMHEAFENFFS